MRNSLFVLLLFTISLVFIASCEDDEPVTFTFDNFTIDLDENPSQNQVLGTISATASSGEITFELINESPAGALAINAGSGELSVADPTLFDFESLAVISAGARISSEGSSTTVAIIIRLNDVEAMVADFNMSIDENPTVNQVIGTIEVTGSTDNNSFELISQSPADAMNLNNSTGELTVADPSIFDFEVNPSIMASARVMAGNESTTVSILVTINDVQIIASNFSTTIDENPMNGMSIGTINADVASDASFEITMQSPLDAVAINTSTGELTVADAGLFDFESNPSLTGTVLINSENENTSVEFTITLNDIQLSANNFSTTIDEDPAAGLVLGSIDAAVSDNATYQITSQTPSGALAIDMNTGQLSVSNELLFDFETNPVINGNVLISDANETVLVTVEITLNDLNIDATAFNVTIDENPIANQVLGSIMANVSDNATYEITEQTPMGAMAINLNDGELTVLDETLFDFEINPVLVATVLITDGTETTEVPVRVTLNDLTEFNIWEGPTLTFTKADNTDPNLTENQDRITERVIITRGNRNSIYNIVLEPDGTNFANRDTSPLGTEWAEGNSVDIETLTFTSFRGAVGNNLSSVVGRSFVLHLIEEDIYIDITFNSWSAGLAGGNGGFSYTRSTE